MELIVEDQQNSVVLRRAEDSLGRSLEDPRRLRPVTWVHPAALEEKMEAGIARGAPGTLENRARHNVIASARDADDSGQLQVSGPSSSVASSFPAFSLDSRIASSIFFCGVVVQGLDFAEKVGGSSPAVVADLEDEPSISAVTGCFRIVLNFATAASMLLTL